MKISVAHIIVNMQGFQITPHFTNHITQTNIGKKVGVARIQANFKMIIVHLSDKFHNGALVGTPIVGADVPGCKAVAESLLSGM